MSYKRNVLNENTDLKPVAVVLGGTVPHGEVLKRMRKRGYYTVLIDYFENPPAKQYADVHYRESAMDYEVVRNIVQENKAEVILSCCLDQQMNIAMKAAEELHIRHPFSSETAFNVTNKTAMKRIMQENHIPTPRCEMIQKGQVPNIEGLRFPLIIKPADNCGAAGVNKIFDKEYLDNALNEAFSFSPSGNVLIEEFIEGAELSCHFFVKEGKAVLVSIFAKMPTVVNKTYRNICAFCSSDFRKKYKFKLEKIANEIVSAFFLPENTPLFYQAIVNGDDIKVFEFSPRLGGGVSSYVNEKYFGCDQLEYSICSYLEEKCEFEVFEKDYTILTYTIYCHKGIYDRIEGCEQLINADIVDDFYYLKMPGDHMSEEKPSAARICVAIIKGDSPKDCFEKMLVVNEKLKVLDPDGVDIKDSDFVWDERFFEKYMHYLSE